MTFSQYFLIGFAAGLLCSLLPYAVLRLVSRVADGYRRDALWRPVPPRLVRRDAARLMQPRPRHLGDVRLGLLRRGC